MLSFKMVLFAIISLKMALFVIILPKMALFVNYHFIQDGSIC